MVEALVLTFNPFQENTYIVYDDSKECVIFDPGCYSDEEKQQLVNTIEKHGLKPARLINTHCHLDHVFGNQFVADKYQLPLEIHRGELPVLQAAPQSAIFFGIPNPGPLSPEPGAYIEEGDVITFGNTRLEAILTPGHSPASLSFFCREGRFLIAGDVLFQGSIGRTDLPGRGFQYPDQQHYGQVVPAGRRCESLPRPRAGHQHRLRAAAQPLSERALRQQLGILFPNLKGKID